MPLGRRSRLYRCFDWIDRWAFIVSTFRLGRWAFPVSVIAYKIKMRAVR